MAGNSATILAFSTAPKYSWLLYFTGLVLGISLGLLIPVYSAVPIVIIAGLAVTAIIFRYPYVGLLLVAATIPADVSGMLSGKGSAMALSITKLLGVLTVLAAITDILLRQKRPNLERLLTPQTATIVVLVFITIASCLISPTKESFHEVVRLITILLFVLITVYFVDCPDRIVHILWVLAIAATIVAMQSIAQRSGNAAYTSEEWVAGAGAVLDVSEVNVGNMLRTTGTFSHPAWLGLFLSITIPLTLFIVWTARHPLVVIAGLASIAIQILGVFSTYSRMAYVGVALGLCLFALRRRFGPALLVVLIIGSVVVFPAMPDEIQARMRSILKYQESSSSVTRIGQQLAGWYMFQDNPVFGVGPGNFEDKVLHYGRNIREPFHVEPIGAHNMFVEVAAELGIPGLITVLVLLVITWRDARRIRKEALITEDKNRCILFECIGIAMLVFVVSSLFVHAQYRKEWWLLVALVAAGRSLIPLTCNIAGKEALQK